MDEVFAPPGVPWTRVSQRLTTVGQIKTAVATVAGIAAGLAVWQLMSAILVGVAICLVALGLGVANMALIPRRTAAWGYAERDDDLFVTHGVMVRRLTVVPYGRMQFVDVTSDPLNRRFGIATVRLHTASADSNVIIEGVAAGEAIALRDRLTVLGEARAAGL